MQSTVNPAALTVNPSVLQVRSPSRIDLTGDDDTGRVTKRPRLFPGSSEAFLQQPASSSQFYQPPPRQVIDLTTSPSPPLASPHQQPQPQPQPVGAVETLPADLSPRTPVCIGQLTVTALVLYPVPYIQAVDPAGQPEYAPVRLQYECNPKRDAGDTIQIKVPHSRSPTGELVSGDAFAVVEQKVASALGPMLGKGLIRLDAKVRRGNPSIPILPLQILVYTPYGNIRIVGNYLHQCALLLDHPSPHDSPRISSYPYANPHNPPPGGFSKAFQAPRLNYPSSNANRWSTPGAQTKSVEVQRSQADELFKGLKTSDDIVETEPTSDVATPLYPHQKKALTFLLEREREKPGVDGIFASLWQRRRDPITNHMSYLHQITQREVHEEPHEGKGAILADDMGLGKTITCVALIASTMSSARSFASSPLDSLPPRGEQELMFEELDGSQFSGKVWGMPSTSRPPDYKGKSQKAAQDKQADDYVRRCRLKTKSRATLVICPLSTVSNWEDQFREHWKGEVTVMGGAGGICTPPPSQSMALMRISPGEDETTEVKPQASVREGNKLKLYIYHGNARRLDPTFLADFDVVITTYSTLASEFSKQTRSLQCADDDEEDGFSSDGFAPVEFDDRGSQIITLPKPRKAGTKRKKPCASNGSEISSALQSVHWFRVVLDEAHSIKETNTVASKASCDLFADRRLCITGTPVQNKLDDVFALVKFLRLQPLDDKSVWTEFVGSPVKFGQPHGIARLQTIMKCITLRRTKESKSQDGQRILDLPPRTDEVRYLKFDEHEKSIYDQFFNESKAEFTDLSSKNEVMKNYVGILQKILRLRQICDHFELVDGKGLADSSQSQAVVEDVSAAIQREGITLERANAIFAILRDSALTQCVECGGDLSATSEAGQDGVEAENALRQRRPKKTGKVPGSRGSTRANSPVTARILMTRCQHLFCIECYRRSTCPGWPNCSSVERRPCSACQFPLAIDDVVELSDPLADSAPKKKSTKRERRQKGQPTDPYNHSTKVKTLLHDLISFSKANPYSINYEKDSVEIQMVDREGNNLDNGVTKTVVFSQWTSMLDKVEDALEEARIRYDRLDGSMKRDERIRAMEALKNDPGCEVLLVSLKAGGVGLNLTAAQRVYLMDPYWNPAVENQAVDRIHRLGQRKPVTTVKLIIENSIEARLLAVQKKKTELANMTFGQTFTRAELMERRMEELNTLFR